MPEPDADALPPMDSTEREAARDRLRREILEVHQYPERFCTVADAADILERSQTWVKSHAGEIGGRRFPARDLGLKTPGMVWRFRESDLQEIVEPVEEGLNAMEGW